MKARTGIFAVAVALLLAIGCQTRRAPAPASQPSQVHPYFSELDALAAPPVGWSVQPLKSSPDHAHRVWISPSGHTAYGIIRFTLPWPVGHRWALWGFLRQMRADQGQAVLLNQRWDATHRLLRFEAEGGMYHLRTNLVVRGTRGWAVYAGTLRDQPIQTEELADAEAAREQTRIQR